MNEIFFAGGCFWGTQHLFKQLRGVVATEAGYANGVVDNPTYEQVYTDTTGYAECVRVEYDPRGVSLELLLELYFRSIDPLSLNAQGGDVGTRYRTGIYYLDGDVLPTIREAYNRVEAACGAPLAVEVLPLTRFYAAEEYHQNYLDKHPAGYCHIPQSLIEAAKKM